MPFMPEPLPKPRRRWLRFSLRSLLLLVVVISIPLGWKVNRARNQRVVVEELQKLNAVIEYDYEKVPGNPFIRQPPPAPKWLTDLLGIEYFGDVVKVEVEGPQVNDETIALVARLPELHSAGFASRGGITDSGLVHFARMHKLEEAILSSNRIAGTGLVFLTGLKRLKLLWVDGSITDSYLEHASELNQLERFEVHSVKEITDDGLAHLAKLTNLRILILGRWSGGKWTPSVHDYMKATDDGLLNLYGMKNLELLHLDTINVTRSGIDGLRKALPNCQISWANHDPDPIDETTGNPHRCS